jgi:hypothetical protein
MSQTKFIASLCGLSLSVLFTPALEEMAKVYIITVVVFVTLMINFIFRANQVREWIVRRITTDVMNELFKDKDVRRLLAKKFSEGEKLDVSEE